MMEIKEYARKVKELRNAQKAFFKVKKYPAVSQTYLELSKKLEKEIDIITDDILIGSKQGDLF